MQSHVNRNFLLAFACALTFISCRKEETPAVDIGLGYFPTQIGHWVIYEVDSTVYDDFLNDTFYYRYQVKEVLESNFTDNEGREAIRVERYRRDFDSTLPYDSIPWHLSRVWSFTRTNYIGEKMEENERFIRLAFPAREDVNWNGNAYNTIGSWNYKYKSIDAPFTIANMSFDSTVLVEQKREINRLNHRSYQERYAKNVGMILKNVIDVRDTNVGNDSVIDRIYAGVIYNIKLVDYGPR
ncbi:MAG: hypothetical protein RL007_2616 [Bacteroidota bacterium]